MFTLFMSDLTTILKDWSTLRKLSVYPSFCTENTRWTLVDEAHLSSSLEEMDKKLSAACDNELPFLDNPDPPFFTEGYPTTLDDLCGPVYPGDQEEEVEQGIREALYVPCGRRAPG
ncbi:hypothetical protein PHLGIDRAFT_400582 [Phlebiopsis gigantea 11061_1 CR5-6]|uniref:Uncharacterized protein n=1 Tax=Phlebiopsis gigantea (strain 11061_1 CR5-6) TaxID=745531 RepID=A0A0C3S6V8_PHLG1|nr:hypothetical protein PHLGIDRAFT_400582 [Phlebiopsis gigantea 11061_1 CR5-6]